jgi:hypothetical protein
MFSRTSLSKRSAAATAFSIGCITIAIAVYPAQVRSGTLNSVAGAVGNTVGAATNGVTGAVGSITGTARNAIGATATTSSNTFGGAVSGHGAGNVGNDNGTIRSGNWINAPFILKRNARSETQDGCRNTFLDYVRSHKCDKSPAGVGESPDQASYSDDDESVVPNIARKAPGGNKPAIPKSIARLNVEKPSLEESDPSVLPKARDAAKRELLSCDKAETIVGSYGFLGVNPSDCDGQVLAFNANRDGKSYLITLNATSGELIKVSKITGPAGLHDE